MVKSLERGCAQKNDVKSFAEGLQGDDNPIQLLSEMLSKMKISDENVSDFENIVDILEIYEAEVRRLRQSISLNIREYVLASYAQDLRKKKGKR